MLKILSIKHPDLLVSRLALFIVYFWFGVLKLLDLSPASPLVLSLLKETMPFIEPGLFLMLFGAFEMVIGLSFLFPRFEKLGLALLTLHLIAIFVPLILLADKTWQSFLVPTMEGQYIIKNVLIVAVAVNLLVRRRTRLY